MKISLRWIENVVGQKLDKDDVVRRIGAQLGAIEEVIDFGAKYNGAVVVKVITSVDHPDSDHLHVCMIDDGGRVADVERDENGYVQVVCGAANAVAGITVAWLPPGSTVPESYGKDPFVLGKRQLRGVVSNGMLASPKELDLYDDHSGILEIDLPDVKLGQDFKELYDLDDTIIDCENKMFTHRPDCFGALGVAREIAGISGLQFKSPEWYMAQSAFLPRCVRAFRTTRSPRSVSRRSPTPPEPASAHPRAPRRHPKDVHDPGPRQAGQVKEGKGQRKGQDAAPVPRDVGRRARSLEEERGHEERQQ